MNFRRATAGFAATLLLITLFAAPNALADPTDTTATAGVSLADCAQANGVYVVVTPEDGSTTGACVTNPASGTAALQAAAVTVTRDATGMICALNDYPDPCPASFNGKYWQYYQASADDAIAGNWSYATVGSDDTKPAGGSVEGWCYGEQCLPKLPSADLPGGPATSVVTPTDTTPGEQATFGVTPVSTPGTPTDPSLPATSSPAQPSHTWAIVAGVAIVAAVVIAAVLLMRRRSAGKTSE